jgi:6-phosphogluconolactonase (cycloisomerase 2 family)
MGLGMTSCGGGTVGFMWVLGTQNHNIGGFKIDDYTGNLTGIVGSPFDSGGTNPVMLTLKSGGRFLYVLNAGDSSGQKGNIELFSVGGDGVLSPQNSFTSQGTFPVWITTDTTGNYLFELDQRAPDYDGVTDFNGSITAWSLDPNTGRASLITNAQVKNAQGTQLTYFEVGKTPIQMRATSSCIYTLDSGDQTIFPYALGSANGQLTQPTNSTLALGTTNATSVNIGGSYIYVTDAGSSAAVGAPGTVLPFTTGSNCSLSTVTGGKTPNLTTASYPIQTINYTAGGNSFFYVLNHSTPTTNGGLGSISGFDVTPGTGELTQLPAQTASNNPYNVGKGPVCFAIDPTNQYIYTSDQTSSTVTGSRLSSQYGTLSSLTRGNTFPTVGAPSCLVISPNTGY